MIVVKAEGYRYYDETGQEWLDLTSGNQNTILGHGNLSQKQAYNSVVTSGITSTGVNTNYWYDKLVSKLHDEYHQIQDIKILSTGTEALERAIRVAREWRGSQWSGRIACLPGAFHGKSYLMASAYYNWGYPFHKWNPTEEYDIILYEPVQNYTGNVTDEEEIYRNSKGAILIADEIVTGFGRCSAERPFISKYSDIIVSGKTISNGLPITFVISPNAKTLPDTEVTWSTTCAGNALSCAMAYFAIDSVKRLATSGRPGELFNIAKEYIPSVKGAGSLICIPNVDIEKMNKLFEENNYLGHVRSITRLSPVWTMDTDEWRRVCLNISKIIS